MPSWSYHASQLATSKKDQVRNLIGDTFQSDPQLYDEEINFHISMRGSVWGAAAECCRALCAKYARVIDQAVGTAKIMYSQRSKRYASLAMVYDGRAASVGSGLPYAGGVSISDMLNQEQNTDRPEPQFTIGMMENLLPVAPTGGETITGTEDSGTAETE